MKGIKRIIKKVVDLIFLPIKIFTFLIVALLIMRNFLFLPGLNKKLSNLLGEKLIFKVLLSLLIIIGIVLILKHLLLPKH